MKNSTWLSTGIIFGLSLIVTAMLGNESGFAFFVVWFITCIVIMFPVVFIVETIIWPKLHPEENKKIVWTQILDSYSGNSASGALVGGMIDGARGAIIGGIGPDKCVFRVHYDDGTEEIHTVTKGSVQYSVYITLLKT